jgi:hypothetical protein
MRAIIELPRAELSARAGTMLMEILRRSHLSAAHDLSTVIAEESRALGLAGVVLYVVDYEERLLVPVPGPGADGRPPLPVQGTVAGRSYAAGDILDVATDDGRRVWLPLLDGTERMGVAEFALDGQPGELAEHVVAVFERFAHFIAGMIVTKDPYSDHFKLLRRRQRVTTATELLREMVPPATLATKDVVLAATLEPAYDVGGDAYDYAINGDTLHLGIFDGVGHGLAAAGVTAFALSAYRHSRRVGDALTATYAAIDAEVAEQYPGDRYVTACLAQLDVSAGRLRWVSAGHPPPLLLRGGRFIRELTVRASTPMGLRFADGPPAVGEVTLEPGDMVVLYTDGLTESRRPDGRLFTTERLAEFIERQAGSGEAAPDTLRRLRQAIIERGEGTLRDDATAMLVEWRRGSQETVLPPTVLGE